MRKNYLTVKWSIWWILTFSFILVLFLRLSTAVVTDNLSKELGFSQLQISNIASLSLYSYALMQIPAGILIYRYGAREISSVGMIISGVGSILFGTMNNVYLAYLSRIMVGIGTSVILLAMFKVQGNWFKKEEFPSITAKFAFIGNLGTVFATFPLVYLNDYIGWRNSFILIGVVGIAIGISIYLIVRNTPKDYGFNVDLKVEQAEKIRLQDGLKSVFTNKSTWYNSLILFSLVGISTAFTSLWGVTYITDVYNVSKSVSAFIISFFTYGFVVGSMFMNFLFNKIKCSKFNILKIGAFINILIWGYIIILCKVKPPIIILPIAFFIIGCINMGHLQAFNDVKYKNEEKYSGLSTSIVNTSEFIGSGLINLIIAFIIQSSTDIVLGYRLGFSIFIIMNIITVIASDIGIKNDTTKEDINYCS